MALKDQLSFSNGELDPVLNDRVTLQRFQNSLATARNVMVGKTGSILSRFSRVHFGTVGSYEDQFIKIFAIPNTEKILLFYGTATNLVIRIFSISGGFLYDTTLGFGVTDEEIENLQFIPSNESVYVLFGPESDKFTIRVKHTPTYAVDYQLGIFFVPGQPSGHSLTWTGSGYDVHYAVTKVRGGEESRARRIEPAAVKKPSAAGESAVLEVTIDLDDANIDEYNEIRVYRKPAAGAAYGFIGRSTDIYIDAADANKVKGVFEDLGGLADFSNGIPSAVTKEGIGPFASISGYPVACGTIYQQRLILANFTTRDSEAIAASRPGYQNNFFRDYPYDADSALLLKAGSEGTAKVLRMIDSDGLVVFTSVGVYASVGVLSPTNLALQKRGNWIIDEKVPPLAIPGGLFFVDKTTNSVRQLIFSQELGGYDSVEQSIFSDHLFKEKKIKSWAYQEGSTPILIVTFSDGTFATFSYSFEHKLRAWTRHDSKYPVEQVSGSTIPDTSFFVINKNGTRYVERSIPRFASVETKVSNPEYDKLENYYLMDGLVIDSTLSNDQLSGSDEFVLTPVTAGEWDGNLTLTCGTSGVFAAPPGFDQVGFVYRFFDINDRSVVDLEVIAQASDDEVTVRPSSEFPSEQATGFRLYLANKAVTSGLDHLEGEEVCVVADGNVISSPNNDHPDEAQTTLTVSGGEITLPDDIRGAYIIVGRPVTCDVKTLNISTVSQAPTIVESLTVNELYMRVFESRGLFVSNEFSDTKENGTIDGSSVKDMQNISLYNLENNQPIIANRYKQPTSERFAVTTPGSWESNGQLAIRQVDPLQFQILSIIADVEVLRRSN